MASIELASTTGWLEPDRSRTLASATITYVRDDAFVQTNRRDRPCDARHPRGRRVPATGVHGEDSGVTGGICSRDVGNSRPQGSKNVRHRVSAGGVGFRQPDTREFVEFRSFEPRDPFEISPVLSVPAADVWGAPPGRDGKSNSCPPRLPMGVSGSSKVTQPVPFARIMFTQRHTSDFLG